MMIMQALLTALSDSDVQWWAFLALVVVTNTFVIVVVTKPVIVGFVYRINLVNWIVYAIAEFFSDGLDAAALTLLAGAIHHWALREWYWRRLFKTQMRELRRGISDTVMTPRRKAAEDLFRNDPEHAARMLGGAWHPETTD